jgi:hypothetical protein
MRLQAALALLSWFAGGILLGLIEVVALPKDPNYSTLLQLLPLLLLIGGIWFVISQYQRLGAWIDQTSHRLRLVMTVGWVAVFGINAGIASINNMANDIFHQSLPYYFQGISLAQKLIALSGVFVLGIASTIVAREDNTKTKAVQHYTDFWEKPLTNIGFIALLLGVILGLAQYWSVIVFSGFFLLLAGIMLYPVGRLTEKDIEGSDAENREKYES